MAKSDVPFGSEFSPSQVDLPDLLEIAATSAGDPHDFENRVYENYFQGYHTSERNRRKLANNTKLAMTAYGIINADSSLTKLGKRLRTAANKPDMLYAELARHILLNLRGWSIIQCVEDMAAAGEPLSLNNLRRWLGDRGVRFPRGGKHASVMRLWLEKAGVVQHKSWRVNPGKAESILGTTLGETDRLATLSPNQRSYLKTLANMEVPGPHRSSEIERLATAVYGTRFDEKNLPKAVLYPLRDAGYIAIERGTREPGRGAKPFLVKSTEKLRDEVLLPILDQIERQVGSDMRPLLRKPLAGILDELSSSNRHVRGLALEALAFKLMRLVDLDYVATRLRGVATGGAEVDLVFESARLVFTRWQVQCKNVQAGVTLDDVAKEVGLTHMLKSNAVAVVSTGGISDDARQYANSVMRDSNLAVILIDRTSLDLVKDRPAQIVDVLTEQAQHAMKLKTLQL
jgi:site-specific DNA-methyltransferase (cytosine-N4-specific)